MTLPDDLLELLNTESEDWEGKGRMSAMSAITLSAEARHAANVPPQASGFAFAYPLPDEEVISDGCAHADAICPRAQP